MERGGTSEPKSNRERKRRASAKRGRSSFARVNALAARRAFLTPVLHRFEWIRQTGKYAN